MNRRREIWMILLAFLAAAAARGAGVSVELSSMEVEVGTSFFLNLTIENAKAYDDIDFPEIDGAHLIRRHRASRSSVMNNFNGRVTRHETVTIPYEIRADRAGVIEIPPLAVIVDGQQFKTRPLRLTSVEPGAQSAADLLLVEVRTERDDYYIGQSIDATLEVWIRPFTERTLRVRLDADDMWTLVQRRLSNFGVFTKAGKVTTRERLRAGPDGVERAYYVYAVPARLTPTQTGPLSFGEISVVMTYPLRVQRGRRLFDLGGLRVVESRTVSARPTTATCLIREPPLADRPSVYAGAVGRFDIRTSATPVSVTIGDPIELTIHVRDLSREGAPLEMLQPPVLGRVAALTHAFQVPDDTLVGRVDPKRPRWKSFVPTIRATRRTDEIPPIPFAYFDPDRERYVTVESAPIPITVAASDEVDLNTVVGNEKDLLDGNGPMTTLTSVAGGILANVEDHRALLRSQEMRFGLHHWLVLLLGPATFAAVALGHRRQRRLRDDRAWARRRVARRKADERLARARSADVVERASETARAVTEYIADRLDLPAGALTRSEVVHRLDSSRLPDELLTSVEDLLRSCDATQYAGDAADVSDALFERAEACLGELEKLRLR